MCDHQDFFKITLTYCSRQNIIILSTLTFQASFKFISTAVIVKMFNGNPKAVDRLEMSWDKSDLHAWVAQESDQKV